jgi:hypothetical protein
MRAGVSRNSSHAIICCAYSSSIANGFRQAHRALHPFGPEMQEAHAALLRKRDGREARLAALRERVRRRAADFGRRFRRGGCSFSEPLYADALRCLNARASADARLMSLKHVESRWMTLMRGREDSIARSRVGAAPPGGRAPRRATLPAMRARQCIATCDTEEVMMKTATFPSIRVEPELREAAENVLQEGETLSAFVEQSIREGIERRRLQSEFIARGIASRDEARRTGNMCRRPRYWNDWAGSSTRCVPGHDRRDDVYGSLHTGGIP